MLASSAVTTAMLLAWILNYSRYGFDFTDESFYLIWIADPFLFDWSLTQFGFIYHPLYVALGGDIASLRQANIGIVFTLSWCLTGLALHSSSSRNAIDRLTLLTVSAGFSVASLVTFASWLVTPNYNTLAFQALLVASIGMILADAGTAKRSILGWFLIGIGGWLAFMAKPSTALALATGALIFLLVSRKFSLRLLCMAIVVALTLLVVSILLIDGSIHGFIARLQTALAFYDHLGAGHTLANSFRLDRFFFLEREKVVIQVTCVLAFVGAWCALLEKPQLKTPALLVSAVFFAAAIAIVGGVNKDTGGFGEFRGMVLWSIDFATFALVLAVLREKTLEHLDMSHWSLALLFLAMPHVYAFGTNGNYWWAAGFVGIFWLLGSIVLLGPLAQIRRGWGFALPLVFATQALSATILQTGLTKPYRQPQALSLNDTVVAIGQEGSDLVLSSEYAGYLEAAKLGAREAGLKPRTPVIDLTGQSPGILYALQAQSIGQAWTVGGYPGSQKLAESALARVPCELISAAWLLVEESGPRRLPTDVVASYGANFSAHFEHVATWQTAQGAGGYAKSREQKLFRPIDQSFVLAECKRNADARPK